MVGTMIGFSQQKIVRGNVTDENGLPLHGTTVIELETNNGTTTDFDGNYSITLESSSLLEDSYVGYKTEIVSTSDPDKLNVSMQLSGQLDEIVLTALGISREKKSLGYSTQTVDGDDIADVKGTNLFDALSGEVAGLDNPEDHYFSGITATFDDWGVTGDSNYITKQEVEYSRDNLGKQFWIAMYNRGMEGWSV